MCIEARRGLPGRPVQRLERLKVRLMDQFALFLLHEADRPCGVNRNRTVNCPVLCKPVQNYLDAH